MEDYKGSEHSVLIYDFSAATIDFGELLASGELHKPLGTIKKRWTAGDYASWELAQGHSPFLKGDK